MVSRRFLFCLLISLLAVPQLHAQLRVDLKLSRHLYMAYEPLLASVTITNYSGRDITLENSETENWLSFQITSGDGTLLPPREGKTRFDPRTLTAGESCHFAVNLVRSYPITEFGPYRIRASVYFTPMNKYFSSQLRNVEISDGKLVWQQNLGVPAGLDGVAGQRQVSLLTFRTAEENALYVRVEDKEAGVIYATQKVGPMIAQGLPQIEVDPSNQVHLLQIISPKTYLYTRIGINGEPMVHATYYETKSRPKLRHMPSGEVGIAGGQSGAPVAAAPAAGPKISDRPADLPKE